MQRLFKCIYSRHIKTDDTFPLPPTVQKRNKNIPVIASVILQWGSHLEAVCEAMIVVGAVVYRGPALKPAGLTHERAC